jgi:asparagine synthase (glutamine-hydrolysing)
MTDPFLRLTPLESMLSLPFDDLDRAPARPPSRPVGTRATDVPRTPQQAFEQIVAEAYVDDATPPYVLFSGGRDSSAVLAVTTDLARRTGRADPVPVIVRHLDDPDADETSWQELVLDHLRITDPVVLTFRDDQRLLGEVAVASLTRRGPLWPAAVTLHAAIYRHLRPGFLLTGEGGDHVMLPQRITELRNGLHYRRPVQLAWGVGQLYLTRHPRRRLGNPPPWLTADGLRWTQEAFRRVPPAPVRFDRGILGHFGSAYDAILLHNFAAMAAEHGLTAVHPFIDLRFRTAWAEMGGALGFAGRNDNMRRLFGRVLPEPILVRDTKADFTASRWGEAERAFARDWDGRGVDPGLIRAEDLRADWLTERPHAFAEYLLHHVWAATRATRDDERASLAGDPEPHR